MPPARPKQRQLIRWNDDLDKSLLLFITHTCADLGIKIPYNVVAQRMGSIFTEGAIQQHISKLRKQMGELQNVPVPPPVRRGTVTSKPSSVYAPKGRNRAIPAPPPPQVPGKRGNKIAMANDGYQVTETRKRARRGAAVKRSASDDGDSHDEFHGGPDDEFGDPSLTSTPKRQRITATGSGYMNREGQYYNNALANSQARQPSRVNQMMDLPTQADARRGDGLFSGQRQEPIMNCHLNMPAQDFATTNQAPHPLQFSPPFHDAPFPGFGGNLPGEEAEEEMVEGMREPIFRGLPNFPDFDMGLSKMGLSVTPPGPSDLGRGQEQKVKAASNSIMETVRNTFNSNSGLGLDFGGFSGFGFDANVTSGSTNTVNQGLCSALPGVSDAFPLPAEGSGAPTPRNTSFDSRDGSAGVIGTSATDHDLLPLSSVQNSWMKPNDMQDCWQGNGQSSSVSSAGDRMFSEWTTIAQNDPMIGGDGFLTNNLPAFNDELPGTAHDFKF